MSNPLLAFRRDEDFSFGGVARGLPPGVHLEFYGGGKGGSSTQTVSVPPEVLARYNAVNARAEQVAQTPFTPYSSSPEAFVAPLSSSQQAGIGNINALQGSANQAVQQGQNLQSQGIDTARTGQSQANAIDQAALQGISQAQQQGTAYNQAAGQNIGQAMSSASPYMQQMAGLTQAGLGQGQQYLGGATDLTQRAIQTGQQYANRAEPYYTGALQAGQPLNQQAQQYMQAGTQAVNPQALDYSQYMNPYMNNVVQAQQALQAQENAQQRSALQGKAIQSGAFGGNRSGIEQANLARQQSLANQATMANLLQSGYGQAQAAAQQQQGVGLGAAQANRAAQQAAAQQAAALGQQQYAQQLGVGQGLAALGQQQYGQALGTGAQIGQLGQQGYTQNLGAGAQLGQVGQQLYAQNIGQGQAIQGLGNQQFTQGLQGSQAAAGIGQNIFGNAAQTAGITQAGGMNTANLGMQNQAAQIAAAQAQMAAGQQQQQTDQAGKTALYNQFLQQQGYPFQVGQYLANIAEGTGALSGSTTSAQRTGQRGGRMGDGYASGGLVPDSQGGAVYEPGAYYRGGLNTGGRTGFAAGGWSQDPESGNWSNGAEEPTTMSNADYQQMLSSQAAQAAPAISATEAEKAKMQAAAEASNPLNAETTSIKGLDPKVADLYQSVLGRTPDPSGARYWQDMFNAGMSLDQIKYNMQQSPESKLKSGDVNALKGTPLTYNAGNFSKPVAPVQNQYGAYSAGDFTPAGMGYGQRPAYGQPQGYGNISAMQGGYGGYGGGMMGGYGQPSNYGMPNFGSSPQYGGAPDYAGAMQYGGMQSQYGMPQFGRQQNYYPQQATPQATGKGPAPVPQQATPAPTATGKGTSAPPPTTGKGPSTGGTATGFNAGGRVGRADGGRAGYALQGSVPMSGMPIPGDPYGALQAQAAMFANAPGAAMGYVPPSQGGAGQYKMLTPQASILPQQQSGIKEAIGMGTSIASLGEAGSKLYSKLSGPKTTGAQDVQAFFNKGDAASQAAKDAAGGLNAPNSGFKIFGQNDVPSSAPEAVGKGAEMAAANGGRIGHNSGGRIGYAAGGIPGLDDLKQGYAGIPGNEGTDTPMSQVITGGTKTPTELKAEMDRMSSGSGGMGGGSNSGLNDLANVAMTAGKIAMMFLSTGGRVGKAGGGSLVDPSNPQDQAMAESFDNLLQRYDNNPLLAAAAMDVGTKVVDAAIQKAQQTGGDITDFLPRRTQEYMFALSKAALGAHEAINRPARAAGGRTGYALPGFVNDEPTGLAPAPSDAMSMGDFAGGLSPQGAGVQVAGPAPAADKSLDYDAMIGRASKETGIPADLLRAQIKQESRFDPNAIGKAGEIGLTQVLPSTAKKPGFGMAGVDPETLRDPEQNILFGAKYLAARGQAAGVKDWNNPEEAAKGLRAYNGGGDPNYVANVYRHMGLTPPANVGEQKPVQVAGLAPKTDAGPFETIGKKILPDAVPTDSSFWVPLIAGLGTMLASDKYRFSQRLGEGLVGGAAAYGKSQELGLQQQKVDIEARKNALTSIQGEFQYLPNGSIWSKTLGRVVSPAERDAVAARLSGGLYNSMGSAMGAAPSTGAKTTVETSTNPVVDTAIATANAPRPTAPPIQAPATQEKPAQTTTKPVMSPEIQAQADVIAQAEQHPEVSKYRQQANDARAKVQELLPQLKNATDNPQLLGNETIASRLNSEIGRLSTIANSADTRADALRNDLIKGPSAANVKRSEQAPDISEHTARAAALTAGTTEHVKAQVAAKLAIAKEAQESQALVQQAKTIRNLLVDAKDNIQVAAGPGAAWRNNFAAIAQNVGISPEAVKYLTGTVPENADAIKKMQTTLGSEIMRQDLPNAKGQVSEFNRYMGSTPGDPNILAKASLWIIDNVIVPKAAATQEAYKKVRGMKPEEGDDVMGAFYDYNNDYPWMYRSPQPHGPSNTTEQPQPQQTQALGPSRPENVPSGSLYNAKLNQWRTPDGKILDHTPKGAP